MTKVRSTGGSAKSVRASETGAAEKPAEKSAPKMKGKPSAWAPPRNSVSVKSDTKFESARGGQTGGKKTKTDPATIGNPPDGEPGLMKDWKKDKVTYQHLEGSLKLGSLSYDDLTQGDAGDCYFLSSAVAIAHDNPDALKKVFTDNGDGTTTVHFFQRGRDGSKKPVDITVDMQFPVGKDGVEYASSRDKTQLWPEVLEKAYAKWKGGYENIGEGGEPKDALFALTGQDSTYTPKIAKVNPDALWKTMTDATGANRPMVAGTFDQQHEPVSYKKEDMIEGHDYTVLKAYTIGGERVVDVRNPWGSSSWKGDLHPHDDDGNFTMKYSDFLKRFEDFTVMNGAP